HLASLRAMPGLTLVRPAAANETAAAWIAAVEADGPVGLCLTRQANYVLADPAHNATPDVVLVGTGSEVQHCLAAAATLAADADRPIAARVVSLPCWEWF